VYAELGVLFDAGQIHVASLQGFLLDEYVGLAADDPHSYHAEIRTNLFDRFRLPAEALSGPEAKAANLEVACSSYEENIREAGGIALQLLGIGSNGHIGFNEPSSSLSSRTRVKTLTDKSRFDNARFFDGDPERVPRHVITQGIGTIREAAHIVLVAWGVNKADAVARCVEGPVTAMVPASALQLHHHVTVIIDEAAASKLSLADYFRQTFAIKPAWQKL
jgi:glucosamine-6-phosphate deaminase